MALLSKRMRDVCSLMLGEHPVTPPLVDGKDLFHIVKLCKGADGVETLYRESDLYFSGFRPEKDPRFYVFNDVEIPGWIPSEILPYDSGYHTTVANISLGPHCFPATFKHLFNFTQKNFRTQTSDRQNAVHWSMVTLSETRRIRSMERKVKRLLRSGTVDTVGASLDDKVHGWGHESSALFAAASDDVNWELIGCGKDLITVKFNRDALPIIIGRLKRAAEGAAATLNEITILIKTFFSIDSNQACNWEQLHYYSQLPNFHVYLVFLLAHEKGISFELRQAAGLLLKNNLQLAFNAMPPSSQKYVKYELLTCIGTRHKQIRSTACTVISVLLQIVGFDKWADLFETLRLCFDSQDLNQKEGAAETIYKICENFPEDSIVDAGLRDLLIYDFVPRLMQLFESPHMSLRRLSLLCVNQCILVVPSEVFRNQFLQGLLELSKQTSTNVKKLVCSSWALLMEHQLIPELYLGTAINSVLLANNELDEDLALEACKFWSYCDSSKGLQKVLPELIPTLVQKMVYTDLDDSLADIKEYESISIRDQDLKRRFHASRLHRFETGKENADDDDDDAVNAWNLRKYSTEGLDRLSKVLRDDILPILMPLIKDKIAQTDDDGWKDREVAVLCINTIAEGCMTGLYSHTPQIFHMLIRLLDDKFPLVRRITCQTISRYSKFIVQSCDREQVAKITMGLLRRTLDTNRKVQEAARSAFLTIGKDAAESNGMEIILEQLILELGKHQARDLWLISEALCSLIDVVGAKVNKAEHLHIFVPLLIEKWQQLQKSNKDILPLLECFTSIAQAAGSGFFQFAKPVFQNCLDLIKFWQLANADCAAPHASDDEDFIVYSLDLLLVLAEALGADTESLVGQSDLIDLIMRCCKDEVAGIRQSALALLGGISMVCHTHVLPRLEEFLEVAAEQLIMQSVKAAPSVANNACWIIGELAMKFGQETSSPVVTTILSRLLPILRSSEGLDNIVVGNTAITLGRLSLVWPMTVSAHLKRSMQAWCNALCMARGDLEKEDGFSGLCEMVEANLSRAVGSLAHVCRAFASLKDIQSEALPSKVRGVLNNLKQTAGDARWEQCMSTLDPSEVQRLASLMAETEPQ
ncbi:hypothetical protein ACQJBY_057188 [Aegilops geniculata]